MKNIKMLVVLGLSLTLIGCGTFTGIPSHGGGKRFAVEQELISETIKQAIEGIDIAALEQRNATIYFSSIGDEGSGNITGGRLSLSSSLFGAVVRSPTSTVRNQYPIVNTTTVSGTTTTTAENALNAPSQSDTSTSGNNTSNSVQIAYAGLGGYSNSVITNPNDTTYLSGLVQKHFALNNVNMVDPSFADVDIYVTVDVFGIVRSRTDWLVYNKEILKAKTTIELMAVDRNTNEVIIEPTSSSYEATYEEDFYFWVGPVKTSAVIEQSESIFDKY